MNGFLFWLAGISARSSRSSTSLSEFAIKSAVRSYIEFIAEISYFVDLNGRPQELLDCDISIFLIFSLSIFYGLLLKNFSNFCLLTYKICFFRYFRSSTANFSRWMKGCFLSFCSLKIGVYSFSAWFRLSLSVSVYFVNGCRPWESSLFSFVFCYANLKSSLV